jgi:hypothetical protein
LAVAEDLRARSFRHLEMPSIRLHQQSDAIFDMLTAMDLHADLFEEALQQPTADFLTWVEQSLVAIRTASVRVEALISAGLGGKGEDGTDSSTAHSTVWTTGKQRATPYLAEAGVIHASELESGTIVAHVEETAAALHVTVVSPKKRTAG